jgi:hypothetical protein
MAAACQSCGALSRSAGVRQQLADRSSAGLEEYIEAYSFLYYLETGDLVSLPQLQKALMSEETGENVSAMAESTYPSLW